MIPASEILRMSSTTVQAICPGCQHPLRIPRELVGKPVKCKKCGTVVRSKPKPEGDPSRQSQPLAAAAAPVAAGYQHAAAPYYPPPAGHAAANPYDPPPGYAYPAAPANPLAVETTSAATSAYKGRGRYKKGGSTAGKVFLILFGLLAIGGLVAAGIFMPGYIRKLRNGGTTPVVAQGEQGKGVNGTQQQGGGSGGAQALSSGGPIPRRLLFVQINNYLYLNPLTSAAQSGTGFGPDRTRAVARQMAYEWRVPTEKDNNQLYVLSDGGAPADVRAPYKNVLVETFQKFFDSSRDQDRIFVYFGGHAVEKDGKAYLVPIEGDPEEVESLYPLDDFYAKLAACKAQQKVITWDVCRYNPQRGKVRPGSETMSAELEKALAKAPAGVQVILTCSAEQNALEFFSHQVPGESGEYAVSGSSFLTAASYVAKKTKMASKTISPTDPLPIQTWVDALSKRMATVAASAPELEDKKRPSQVPKIIGEPRADQVAYNPGEATPARFELPMPPKGASPQLVAAIREEIRLPSLLKNEQGDDGLASFPFPADKLAEYKSDVTDDQIKKDKEKYAFENTVLDAFSKIRDIWDGKALPGSKSDIRRVFEGETSDKAKKTIKEDQEYPAVAILALTEVMTSLEKAAPEREKATKRWQANYDYALAQTKVRLAFMNEYDLLLGQIFTPEVLPVLDREKAGHTGWALASAVKMKSKKDVKAQAEEAQELYAKIIESYKGTPWEIQAKREKGIALGLEWQPYTPGGKTLD